MRVNVNLGGKKRKKQKGEFTSENEHKMYGNLAWYDLKEMRGKLYFLCGAVKEKDPLKQDIYRIMDELEAVAEEIRRRKENNHV